MCIYVHTHSHTYLYKYTHTDCAVRQIKKKILNGDIKMLALY